MRGEGPPSHARPGIVRCRAVRPRDPPRATRRFATRRRSKARSTRSPASETRRARRPRRRRVPVLARPERHRAHPRRVRAPGWWLATRPTRASLAFATRCLDAHVLLAVPRRLAWRVTLVDAACRCDDHLDAGESAKTFLSRAVAQIDDLRALEALDPVPQKPETTAMYDDAERRLRALAAARDEDAAS